MIPACFSYRALLAPIVARVNRSRVIRFWVCVASLLSKYVTHFDEQLGNTMNSCRNSESTVERIAQMFSLGELQAGSNTPLPACSGRLPFFRTAQFVEVRKLVRIGRQFPSRRLNA